MPNLDAAERLAWTRLARTEHVGPVTFASLIARFGSARAAIDELPRLARRGGGGEKFQLPPESEARDEIEKLAAMGGRLIASCEGEFPQGLAALDPPPPLIAVLGHAHILQRDMIAVVGARNASALARKFAHQLARELAEAGLAVVSGLARGIDSAAHEAALEGGTIAVVAGGVDIVYPPENDALYQSIRERGAVVSEMRLGEAPQARHFPRRNRLISGLSRGVVVVEAAERSGSLITANYALEQGREIFAVPGSPLDPRAKGTNRLIREGATLIESAQDVLAVLRPIMGHGFTEPEEGRAPNAPVADAPLLEAEADRIRHAIIESLGPAPVEIDELIRQTRTSAGAVLTILLELELAGRCRRLPGESGVLALKAGYASPITKTTLEAFMADTANPAPLGLAGFGLTTILLSSINAGLLPASGEPVVIPLAIAFGGTAQLIAGIMEFRTGNVFGATAFTAYGAFWWWFALLLLLGGNHLLDLSGASSAIGVCLLLWGVFTLGLWVSTFRLSRLLFCIFLTLWVAFFLLGGGAVLGNPSLHRAGGWVGLLCGALAMYGSFAIVANTTFGRNVAPIGTR